MILTILVAKTDDGFEAHVPTIKGCDTWAHTEEEVMEKITETISYYLKLPAETRFKLDKTKDDFVNKTYKLGFEKA